MLGAKEVSEGGVVVEPDIRRRSVNDPVEGAPTASTPDEGELLLLLISFVNEWTDRETVESHRETGREENRIDSNARKAGNSERRKLSSDARTIKGNEHDQPLTLGRKGAESHVVNTHGRSVDSERNATRISQGANLSTVLIELRLPLRQFPGFATEAPHWRLSRSKSTLEEHI